MSITCKTSTISPLVHLQTARALGYYQCPYMIHDISSFCCWLWLWGLSEQWQGWKSKRSGVRWGVFNLQKDWVESDMCCLDRNWRWACISKSYCSPCLAWKSLGQLHVKPGAGRHICRNFMLSSGHLSITSLFNVDSGEGEWKRALHHEWVREWIIQQRQACSHLHCLVPLSFSSLKISLD